MGTDLLPLQALVLAVLFQTKKVGYQNTLDVVPSPPRPRVLILSNTRSHRSSHRPFLNNTCKLVVVVMSLDLQKSSTLLFVEVLPLEVVILRQPGGQLLTQL
jgi:hypothetical protein